MYITITLHVHLHNFKYTCKLHNFNYTCTCTLTTIEIFIFMASQLWQEISFIHYQFQKVGKKSAHPEMPRVGTVWFCTPLCQAPHSSVSSVQELRTGGHWF